MAAHAVDGLNPLGWLLGLNGVVLVAYVVDASDATAGTVLVQVGGWTLLTAINLMLFSLLHNPCSTTILTIWRETRSVRWTATATLLPLFLACSVTASVAGVWRLVG